jgi:hypothetical protein
MIGTNRQSNTQANLGNTLTWFLLALAAYTVVKIWKITTATRSASWILVMGQF